MLLTISTTHEPADDLGYLLHKHPGRLQSFEVSVGTAHVVYPEATAERCTAALLVEVDPIALVRGRRHNDAFALGQYVNDRPYAASSLLSVALLKVFRTAMSGRCEARPELAQTSIPLELSVPAVPARGGADLVRRLFEPLGWQDDITSYPVDETFPAWGIARHLDLRLTGTARLADALNQLYVLLPVLDDAKHYWVSPDEIDKLIRAGGSWLAEHPDKALITRRYLAHQARLTRDALARLAEVDDNDADLIDNADEPARVTETPDLPVPLAVQRRGAVLAAIRASGASSVADLGCGEGALLADLLAEDRLTRIVATDVSARSLEAAAGKLKLDRMPESKRARLQIIQSSLTYRDDRLARLDAAVLMEVIEHVDPPRLAALERSVFGHAAPGTVVVTTPNAEYNVRWESLPAGTMRHRDHRFEWTRTEFGDWAEAVGARFGYQVRYLPVGPEDPEVGSPTQMAIFSKVKEGTA